MLVRDVTGTGVLAIVELHEPGCVVTGRVGKEHCSVFGERLFSSVLCSVFNPEHVQHFVLLLFVFGVRGLLCSCSDCLFMFSSVFRAHSHAHVE